MKAIARSGRPARSSGRDAQGEHASGKGNVSIEQPGIQFIIARLQQSRREEALAHQPDWILRGSGRGAILVCADQPA